MVLLALSFQGQVEKYGVYVGIAAFFGLAVLSLLYFSQARELKRLREWAGRAPERARELEQRVVAEATATATRRAPSMPQTQGGIAPPRRLAEMPAPPAAQTAAGAQATELADAVDADANGNVPSAPATGAAGAANGAAPPGEREEPAEPATGDGDAATAQPAGDEQPAGTSGPGAAVEAAAGAPSTEPAEAPAAATTAAAAAGAPAAGAGAAPAGGGAEPATGADAGRATEADAGPAAAPPPFADAAIATGAGTAPPPSADAAVVTGSGAPPSSADEVPEREPAAAARPGEVPAAVPRATPAQRVGATPRPAPVPLRQSQPSAVPSAGRGGKRPGGPPPRRAAKPPREGRSAGTVALLVGIAVLILGGGAFVISQLGGEDTPPAPNRAAPPPNEPATGGTGDGSDRPATKPAETNVAVLNGTTFTGLAGQLADTVSREGGFERGATETNTRDQTIQTSTVLYAEGFRSQARNVAELLSISAIEPLDGETQSLVPEADVVVLAGADQTP